MLSRRLHILDHTDLICITKIEKRENMSSIDIPLDVTIRIIEYLPIVTLYHLACSNIGCWIHLCYLLEDDTLLVELLENLHRYSDFERIFYLVRHQRILNCLQQHTLNVAILDAIGSWIEEHPSKYNLEIRDRIHDQRSFLFQRRILTKVWVYSIVFVWGFVRSLVWMLKIVIMIASITIIGVIFGLFMLSMWLVF